MKIMIFFDSMAPSGGIERVISNLIKNVFKDYEVIIVTKDNSDSFYPIYSATHIKMNLNLQLNMQSRFQRIIKRFKSIFVSSSNLKKIVLDINPDYIYVATPLNGLEALLSGISRNKLIVTEHASYYAPNKIYKTLKKYVYKRCKVVISPTTMDYKLYQNDGYRQSSCSFAEMRCLQSLHLHVLAYCFCALTF